MDAPQTLLLNLGDSCRVPFARTEGKDAVFFYQRSDEWKTRDPFVLFLPLVT